MQHPHRIRGQAPQLGDYQCKIRYRQEGQGCELKAKSGKPKETDQQQIPAKGEEAEYVIEFYQPIKGVANGQIVVIYDGDEVVGSGVIQKL